MWLCWDCWLSSLLVPLVSAGPSSFCLLCGKQMVKAVVNGWTLWNPSASGHHHILWISSRVGWLIVYVLLLCALPALGFAGGCPQQQLVITSSGFREVWDPELIRTSTHQQTSWFLICDILVCVTYGEEYRNKISHVETATYSCPSLIHVVVSEESTLLWITSPWQW